MFQKYVVTEVVFIDIGNNFNGIISNHNMMYQRYSEIQFLTYLVLPIFSLTGWCVLIVAHQKSLNDFPYFVCSRLSRAANENLQWLSVGSRIHLVYNISVRNGRLFLNHSIFTRTHTLIYSMIQHVHCKITNLIYNVFDHDVILL